MRKKITVCVAFFILAFDIAAIMTLRRPSRNPHFDGASLANSEADPGIPKLAGRKPDPLVGRSVDTLFADYEKGRFPKLVNKPYMSGGWLMTLPTGVEVDRDFLRLAADSVISLGEEAVPHLFKWVLHSNLAVRYIAIFSLQQITKKPGNISYFDPDDNGSERKQAIARWNSWWQSGTHGDYSQPR